jgi:hypothetical protein
MTAVPEGAANSVTPEGGPAGAGSGGVSKGLDSAAGDAAGRAGLSEGGMPGGQTGEALGAVSSPADMSAQASPQGAAQQLGAGGTSPEGPGAGGSGGGVAAAGTGSNGGGSSVGKGAAAAAAVPAAGGLAQLAVLMMFLKWLKGLAMAMAAMMMNLWNMVLGALVAGAKAVLGFVTGLGSSLSSAVGGAVSATAGAYLVVGSMLIGTTMVGGAAMSTLAASDPSQRDGAVESCSPEVEQAIEAALGAPSPATDASATAEANAQRVYAIFAGMGMSDENVAGILGNWTAESEMDISGVETIYTEPHVMGPRKLAAEAAGFDVDVVAPSYGAKYPAIDKLGIGLGQWTNGRHTMLLDYAKAKGMKWYTVDAQLGFMVSDDDPTRVKYVKEMITTPLGSPSEATERFKVKWEGLTKGNIGDRITAANSWFAKMPSWEADVGLADSLLASSGATVTEADNVAVSDAVSECRGEQNPNADNSSLASAMASYSWPTRAQSVGNDGTELYVDLHNTIFPGDPYFMSCDRAVAVGVRWSGTDDTYPPGAVSAQMTYLSTSQKWEKLSWDGTPAGLQPGDVLLRKDGTVSHTLMYLGSELVVEAFGAEGEPNGEISHGSLGTRSPGVGKWISSGTYAYSSYTAFRGIAPEPASKYTGLRQGDAKDAPKVPAEASAAGD